MLFTAILALLSDGAPGAEYTDSPRRIDQYIITQFMANEARVIVSKLSY